MSPLEVEKYIEAMSRIVTEINEGTPLSPLPPAPVSPAAKLANEAKLATQRIIDRIKGIGRGS